MRTIEQILDEISDHEIAIDELNRELDELDEHELTFDDDNNAQRNADVNMEIRGAFSC